MDPVHIRIYSCQYDELDPPILPINIKTLQEEIRILKLCLSEKEKELHTVYEELSALKQKYVTALNRNPC
jgi:hypothetical protein